MNSSKSHAPRLGALAAGLALNACFWGLGETTPGLSIRFVAPFTNSNAGELQFWLGVSLLLVPGGALLGYALHPSIWETFRRLRRTLAEMDSRGQLLTMAAFFLVVVASARIGRAIFLLDYPITDDEYAARFGGQILAMGKATVPAFEPLAALPTRFLFLHDGKLSAFDWPGVQLAWALSELTRSGPWVFALSAGVTALCVAMAVGRRLGRGWAAIASVLALLSPMMLTLSFTSHAHLLSRGLLAVAIWAYVLGGQREERVWWISTGLALGAAFLCRPMEIACLALPLIADLVVRAARRERKALRAFGALVAGAIGPLLTFASFNWAVTGNPLLPARFAPNPLLADSWSRPLAFFTDPALLWHRFGANSSHNLLMLVIWFAGPVGAALAVLGLSTDRFTRLLGLGILCDLLLGLLHSNFGLHMVGPLHYSECAVPLIILAVHGMARLQRWCEEKSVDLPALCGIATGALVLSLGNLALWQCFALRGQATLQRDIYGFVDSAGLKNAVVLAPRYATLWQNAASEYLRIGSFVYEWQRPKPDWSDEVLILHDAQGRALEGLRARFPTRVFYRLSSTRQAPYMQLQSLGAVAAN